MLMSTLEGEVNTESRDEVKPGEDKQKAPEVGKTEVGGKRRARRIGREQVTRTIPSSWWPQWAGHQDHSFFLVATGAPLDRVSSLSPRLTASGVALDLASIFWRFPMLLYC